MTSKPVPLTLEFCCLPQWLGHPEVVTAPLADSGGGGILNQDPCCLSCLELSPGSTVGIWSLASHPPLKTTWGPPGVWRHAHLGPGPAAATEVSCSCQQPPYPPAGSHLLRSGPLMLPLGYSHAFSGAWVSGCALQELDASERRSQSYRETPSQEGEVQSTPVSKPV